MDFKELRKRAKARREETAEPGTETPAALEVTTPTEPVSEPEERPATAEPDARRAPVAEEEAEVAVLGEEGEPESTEILELLCFGVGDETFAVPSTLVEEIIKPRPITWVPRVPEWVLGIVSLRGTMIPVVDLRRRLQIGEDVVDAHRRILVIDDHGEPCGLLVDTVRNVERIEVDRLEEVPGALREGKGRFLDRLARIGEELLAIVDVDAILEWDTT